MILNLSNPSLFLMSLSKNWAFLMFIVIRIHLLELQCTFKKIFPKKRYKNIMTQSTLSFVWTPGWQEGNCQGLSQFFVEKLALEIFAQIPKLAKGYKLLFVSESVEQRFASLEYKCWGEFWTFGNIWKIVQCLPRKRNLKHT